MRFLILLYVDVTKCLPDTKYRQNLKQIVLVGYMKFLGMDTIKIIAPHDAYTKWAESLMQLYFSCMF